MDFGGFSLFCSLRFRLNLVQNTIKAATSILIVKDEDNMYEIILFINYIRLCGINQLPLFCKSFFLLQAPETCRICLSVKMAAGRPRALKLADLNDLAGVTGIVQHDTHDALEDGCGRQRPVELFFAQ